MYKHHKKMQRQLTQRLGFQDPGRLARIDPFPAIDIIQLQSDLLRDMFLPNSSRISLARAPSFLNPCPDSAGSDCFGP